MAPAVDPAPNLDPDLDQTLASAVLWAELALDGTAGVNLCMDRGDTVQAGAVVLGRLQKALDVAIDRYRAENLAQCEHCLEAFNKALAESRALPFELDLEGAGLE